MGSVPCSCAEWRSKYSQSGWRRSRRLWPNSGKPAACKPATLSKFEAGLLAIGAVIPGPPDLGPTTSGPNDSLGELAYSVVRRQLAVLRNKEPGTRFGEDPEELHDMRVATRRLRAAMDLFIEVLPVRARTFREELGWAAGVLGHVRDLDVQLEAQKAMSASAAAWKTIFGDPEADPLGELADLLNRERQSARAEMLAALDSSALGATPQRTGHHGAAGATPALDRWTSPGCHSRARFGERPP